MKRWIACLLLIGLLGTLVSCRQQETDTAELLDEHLSHAKDLPAGKRYHSGAEDGADGYFSPQLMAIMYGEGAETHLFPLIEEYAIFLSERAEPCEVAIFRCYAKSDTDRIAEMCLSRMELLRIALAGTSYRARVDKATVEVHGRVVTMTVMP